MSKPSAVIESVYDQVREGLRKSGRSMHGLARATQYAVSPYTLCRFQQGHGISLRGLDVLAAELGLEIKVDPETVKPQKTARSKRKAASAAR